MGIRTKGIQGTRPVVTPAEVAGSISSGVCKGVAERLRELSRQSLFRLPGCKSEIGKVDRDDVAPSGGAVVRLQQHKRWRPGGKRPLRFRADSRASRGSQPATRCIVVTCEPAL